MECNKDEAKRAKQIAEEKLQDWDILGAKKFALKAQNLYPSLDGLPQFMDVIDVYISSEKKQNEEINYYEILGADPLSGEELLKKQYKRRALALHPDKNKSVGADGVFKLLSQAWSVLSDKEKRRKYDLKLNIGEASNVNASTATPPVPAPESTPTGPTQNVRNPNYPQFVPIVPRPRNPVPHGTDPFSNPPMNPSYQNVSTSATAQQVPVVRPHSRPANNHRPTSSSPQTFWTCCNGCKMKYEYAKIFRNQNLLCPTCQQPFLATQIQAPSVSRRRGRPSQYSKQQQGVFTASNGYTGVSASASASAAGSVPVSAPSSGSASASRSAKAAPASASTSAPPPAPASVPASVPASTSRSAEAAPCQASSESLKRKREQEVDIPMDNEALHKNKSVPKKVEEGGSSRGLNSEKHDKKRRTDVQNPGDTGEVKQGTSMRNSGLKRQSGNVKQNVRSEHEASSVKESSNVVRAMLMKKGMLEINRCLKFRESLIPKASEKNKVETKNPENASEQIEKKTDEPLINQKITIDETDDAGLSQTETVLMDVPDANFHNFDEDRVEGSFSETQVWAAYDDDDGMPRYYALVQHVMSRNPFKMQVSWLNSKSTVEFGDHEWTRFGFTKTSGNFRAGKSVLSETLNSFSHQVKWNKGSRGAIQIFPTKGDVWALYRNWSPNWNTLTDDEVIHKYDLVVVLEDYHEDRGVSVANLVKIDGFTSVFKQRVDPTGVMTIPRKEMFRFSHQVPYRVLNGLEGENAPSGCYELDPAALPLELLKVATEENISGEMRTIS